MPTSANFGLIKTLQRRTGADRKTCKDALEAHGCDEDAAAAHIAATTEFKDSAIAPAAATCCAGTASSAGVSIVRIEVGDGTTFPTPGDTLAMHYRGTLDDGTEFDSSHTRGTAFVCRDGLGKVIAGWDEGVMKMSLGEKALLLIPAHLGYGAEGHGPVPPNADLKFEVNLLKITRQGDLGGGRRDTQEVDSVAKQMLGMAPSTIDYRLPEDRKLMPLTSEMPE